MSKDIRAFFNIQSKKSSSSADKSNDLKTESKPSSPKKSSHDQKRKRRIIDSDDDEDEVKKDTARKSTTKKSKSSPKKLVEVDVMSMFGSEPVKRKERPKTEKKTPSKSVILIDDDDDLDISAAVDEIESKNVKKIKTPSKEVKQEVKKSSSKKKRAKSKSPTPTPKKSVKVLDVDTPNTSSSSSSKKTKKVKEFSVEDDEARQERKQAALALFHKMKNRATVLNHGCKEIPEGKPDCLKGCQMIISGILESMEREEASDLIKKCGGTVVSGLSKKCTHMLVGEEAGPAKLAKAETLGIKQITEDELLDMIRERSGLKVVKKIEDKKIKTEKSEKLKDSPGKENKEVKNVKIEDKKSPIKPVKVDKPAPIQSSSSSSSTITTKPEHELSFVDKYKPTNVKQIVGQQGPSGNATKLMNWLSKWYKNNDGTKKHAKPNPWAKDNDGSSFKAALLSGPPGVGKTTTAHLVTKELLFDFVEFNASDTRSKKLLKEEVSALLSNTSMHGYANGTAEKPSKRRVLIMDEVDGMAGNEDRGGVAELIALIKESHVPIICMCNDRNHPKIRSLANYCYDLRFAKPNVNQIRGAMMSVCFKEGIKIEPSAVDEIINGTGNDIRQTLNHLALYSAIKETKIGADEAKKNAKSSEKDIKIGTFDVARRIFSADERKKMSFQDKFDLFFNDYSMTSLFVQENYLKSRPNCDRPELLKRIAQTADSLSFGDLVERKIRSSQAWAMLPTQSTFSCFLPGEYMGGTYNAQVSFPSWLGKFSRSNKRKRLAQELHDHTRISTSGSRLSVRLDYAQFLVSAIVRPLKEKGADGVPEALEVIKEYRLLREDIDSLLELTTWPKMKNPWESIEGKVKAALTRAYNKEIQPFSYSVQSGVKKKAAKISDEIEDPDNEDVQESEDEEDESIEKNLMIKVKKPTQAKDAKPSKSSAKSKPKKK